MVGGPGFEPGASRSRTLRRSCPPVSCRVRQCPPVPDFVRRRVRWCPPVTSWFRECVTTSVTRLSHRPVRCRRRDRSPRPRDQRVLADSHERVGAPCHRRFPGADSARNPGRTALTGTWWTRARPLPFPYCWSLTASELRGHFPAGKGLQTVWFRPRMERGMSSASDPPGSSKQEV